MSPCLVVLNDELFSMSLSPTNQRPVPCVQTWWKVMFVAFPLRSGRSHWPRAPLKLRGSSHPISTGFVFPLILNIDRSYYLFLC